jgi:uncharacterized protein
MGRLLVLVVLVVAAVWLIRRALRAPGKDTTEVPKEQGRADELVGCARCGLLLPRAEARAASGGLYCTEEHARLGPGGR